MNSIKLRSKAIYATLIMNRVILEKNKEKKRLLFFVLPDLDDGSIRGITRTGTKQVSQLCFVRKLNTIFIAFLNCRLHIVPSSIFFIKHVTLFFGAPLKNSFHKNVAPSRHTYIHTYIHKIDQDRSYKTFISPQCYIKSCMYNRFIPTLTMYLLIKLKIA